jgi:hypothetical protein
MRHTEVTPEEEASNTELQERLDKFWPLIENDEELGWRVEISGAVSLLVDEDLLRSVLGDNPTLAMEYFGSYEEHNPEERRWEWIDLPEDLIGLYSIEGIYNKNQSYVGGPRTYFFEQGY